MSVLESLRKLVDITKIFLLIVKRIGNYSLTIFLIILSLGLGVWSWLAYTGFDANLQQFLK